MNSRVLLRPEVPEDLSSIVAYVEQFSVAAADRFIAQVFPAMEDLAAMPGKGSPKHFHDARLDGIRSWSLPRFRNFLILYRPVPDGIDVLAVVHGARDLRALLLRRS